MELTEDTEVLEMLFVGLDPLEDGFVRVFVEVLCFLPWARSVERTKP